MPGVPQPPHLSLRYSITRLIGYLRHAQAAGLDVGWGLKLSLEWDPALRAHHVERQLLPGRYQYKLIFDGRWSYDADHPTLKVTAPCGPAMLCRFNMALKRQCDRRSVCSISAAAVAMRRMVTM